MQKYDSGAAARCDLRYLSDKTSTYCELRNREQSRPSSLVFSIKNGDWGLIPVSTLSSRSLKIDENNENPCIQAWITSLLVGPAAGPLLPLALCPANP